MQTFIVNHDIIKSFSVLDNQRLGNQRRETVHIAEILLYGRESRYKNHPAVLMWAGHEDFLLEYLYNNMLEYSHRGFKNTKTYIDYCNLCKKLNNNSKWVKTPDWITDDFILAHKSNLIRKNPEYYRPIFGNGIPDDLPYIWPVRKGK